MLGPDYRVHVTHTYRASHLDFDQTVPPLRPGTVLLNGARVNDQTCPPIFGRWDKMYFTEVAPVPQSEVEFHRTVRAPIYNELRELGVELHLARYQLAMGGPQRHVDRSATRCSFMIASTQ